jgi:O-antigen/teichoic acid export membrane protein
MNEEKIIKSKDLKAKTMSGLAYRFAERITAQLISTIVSIVLARILMPEEYGIITLVTVLITLCNVFVTDGLGNALVQNVNSDKLDFSTCFWAGFGLSLVIYTAIFFGSPFVATFYENPLLTPIMRVMGLRVIVASLNSVQQAYVSKHMEFRKFFFSTLSGTVLSAFVGIYLAYNGVGVWALVAQYMTNSVVDTCVLFFTIRWKPQLLFSFKRFKIIFSFAWKLFVSGFLNQFYNELRSLIIAKKYSDRDLAYYNKGYSFPSLIISSINTSINSVTFPLLSLASDKPEEMRRIVKRGLKTSSYILFPMLIGFAAIAETFVDVVLTEKWLNCVVYIQIFCISNMIAPLNSIAANVMRATGRSDLVLKNNIIIKLIGVAIIAVSVYFGVFWIAIGALAGNLVALIINMLPLKKLIGYTLKEEMMDALPHLLLSAVMGVAVWCLGYINCNKLVLLFIQVLAGALVYIGLSKLFKVEQYAYTKNEILKKLRKVSFHKKEV